MTRRVHSVARALARSEGFTMTELLVVVFLIGIGMAAVFGTLDVSRDLSNKSEGKEAAAQVGEKALEQMLSTSFSSLMLTSAPGTNADPFHPWNYVSGTSYRPDQKAGGSTATEPLIVDGAGSTGFAPTSTWNTGRLSGSVYRFVTWADDPVTTTTTQDQKRITVAVTVDKQQVKPVLLSSMVSP